MHPDNKADVQKVGWTIDEYCAATTLSRSTINRKMDDGDITYAQVGRKRVLTTPPADFLALYTKNARKCA